MLRKNDYPVLEFDDDKDAVVNPFKWNLEPFSSDKLIITFFPEVMKNLYMLSLEIERMPKDPHDEFVPLNNIPYLSV